MAAKTFETDGTGRIIAVFASTFYAEMPAGLIAITDAKTPLGPINLATDRTAPSWSKTGLKVGKSAHLFNGILHIGGLPAIDTTRAKPWQPPRLQRQDHSTLQTALTRLDAQTLDPPGEGYGTTLIAPAKAGTTAMHSGLSRTIRGDLTNLDWARHLLGRGPGLTPAGDDFLGGAMIALHALGLGNIACTLWSRLAPDAEQRTNRISRSLLSAAAQGMGNDSLHHALNAVLTGKNLAPALAELNRIGHSSGWDAFAGAILTFRAALAPAEAA